MSHSAEIIIQTTHLCVAYQDKVVLEDITFEIKRGEFWGILGPNGSGKTTLLRTLLGLIPPISGDVSIFGVHPRKLNSLRDKIGYVPQFSTIDFQFPIKVKDVVLLGRSRKIGLGKKTHSQDWEAVYQALDRVNMSEYAEEQIGRLSGGQRQRIFIARSLALKPDVLLLDEPTAALDPNASESFYEWLHSMQKNMGLTLVIVSHDVGVVSRYVDAIACLNTSLIAHGVPSKVLTSTTLEKMYGCDALLFQHGQVPHMVVSHSENGERHHHD